jgi:hypothetical protein
MIQVLKTSACELAQSGTNRSATMNTRKIASHA